MLLLLTILLLIVICILLYTYLQCFHSPANRTFEPDALLEGEQYLAVQENILSATRVMQNTPCEEVTITSFDGLQLYGRYYHLKDDAPVKIQFHGYRSHALRDCSGGFMLARKMGFNVLAVDQRSHARSQGRVIGFGVLERWDCLYWANYIHQRFGEQTPIILSGLSMGAATVLMSADLDLPGNVVCMIADCPYSSPSKIIRKVCLDRKIPDTLAYPFIRLSARILGGFSLTQSDAVQSVKKAKVPILLIHGKDDRFVPWQMSKEIHDVCNSNCQLHLFPDAGHGLSYMVDPLRYENIIVDFLWQISALQPHLAGNDYVQKIIAGRPQTH